MVPAERCLCDFHSMTEKKFGILIISMRRRRPGKAKQMSWCSMAVYFALQSFFGLGESEKDGLSEVETSKRDQCSAANCMVRD